MIRVGSNSYFNLVLTNINKNQVSLYKTRERISTGKSVNSLEDKPDKMHALLDNKKVLKQTEQYQENVDRGLEYLTVVQSSLDSATNIIKDLKQMVIQGSSTVGTIEWESFRQRADQYLKEMVDLGNVKIKNRYAFSGSSTTTQPFVLAGDGSSVSVSATAMNSPWRLEIGKYQLETVSISGEDAFTSNVNIFDTIIQIRDAFGSQDAATLQGLLDELDSAEEQLLSQGAKAGGMINRFELINSQYESEKINLQGFISNIEDADLLEESYNLQKQEAALQAALTVSSRGMDLSLVNYLR